MFETVPFTSLPAGFAGHELILRKICFTVKNTGEAVFSSGKSPAGTGRERKTNFGHALGHHRERTQDVRDRRKTPPPSAAQEYGTGGVKQAHRSFSRFALQAGKGP